VGAKIFLSLVPNVSSAGARTTKPPSIAQTISSIRSARIGSGNVAQALIGGDRKWSRHALVPKGVRDAGTPRPEVKPPPMPPTSSPAPRAPLC
jgi:hypothetical protein